MAMRINSLLVCVVSAAAQTSAPNPSSPPVQDVRKFQPFPGPPGSIGTQQGYFQMDTTSGPNVHFEAAMEPPLIDPAELKLRWGVFQGTKGNQSVWHRFVIDEVHKQYFGYDLTVEVPKRGLLTVAPTSGAYPVAFSPLGIEPEQLQPSGLSAVPLARYPEPQSIRMGDKIAVDLLVSADGKRRLVDYIELRPSRPTEPPASTSTSEAKDYTPDDGPIHFDFAGYIAINGKRFQGPTFFVRGNRGGATLWLCFPGHQGRYVLSLTPHEGLAKIGAVRDNVVQFEAGMERYEIRMQDPIVGQGAWNLYGVYDPANGAPGKGEQTAMPPLPSGMVAVTGGTERLDNLLP